jgi:ATP-dependent exoDNAse (exonuclease V) alpha subunit
MADYHLRDICSIDKPFGGKQVIFCGDFLQLPPVIKDRRKVESHFTFQSGAWEHARVRRMVLSENFRQTDVTFTRHLSAIRFGNLPARTKAFLDQSVRRSLPVDEPLRLFPVNRKVDALNSLKLRDLPGHPMQRNATFDGDERYRKTLIRNCPVPEKLVLKEGARVMLCRNDYQEGYRNGQRGILESFGSRLSPGLRVKLDGGARVYVGPAEFEWKNDRGAVMASMSQYPVKLAWAVSIHKSQGMTLENVVCDLAGCFEHGQVYVALSRIRTAEGLSLASPISKRQVMAHPDCVKFYPTVRRRR